jgi:hypothetical protein
MLIFPNLLNLMSWDSSVSTVSDYSLDDRGSIPCQKQKDFSCSLCVQTGSGTHPASCTVGTGGLFPTSKVRPGHDADHSPPPSTEIKNESELFLLSPLAPVWCSGTALHNLKHFRY